MKKWSFVLTVQLLALALLPTIQAEQSQASSLVANWTVSGNPGQIAVAPDNSYLYSVDSTNNTLIKVNTTTGASTTLNVGSPSWVAISPSGAKAYVVNSSGAISVIDLATFTLTNSISVCSGPIQFVINPSGTYGYVSCGSSIQKINLSNNLIVSTLSQNNSTVLAIDHSGTYLYSAAYGSTAANQINLSTFTLTTTFSLNNGTTSLAITPDDSRIYDVNQDGYVKWDPIPAVNSNSYSHEAGYLSNSLSINSTGTKMYAVNPGGGDVSVIDLPGVNQSESISIPSNPYFGALSRDDNYLYVAETTAGKIAKISVATLAAPAFTLSSTSETATVGNAINGYTVLSTGGLISSYSISPAASSGLRFDTSTGLLTGTPTAAASAVNYTITGTNATSSSSANFAITVIAAANPAPPVIPDPVQQSKIISFSPSSTPADTFTSVTVNGSFVEKVRNIQVNGINLPAGSWIQTPSSITFTAPKTSAKNLAIIIFNGAVPILALDPILVKPSADLNNSVVKKKVSYIFCSKSGHGVRLVHGINPVCPDGYSLRKSSN